MTAKELASQVEAWGKSRFIDGSRNMELQARWITHGDYERYECSHCGKDSPYSVAGNPWQTNYCPHCGARMESV